MFTLQILHASDLEGSVGAIDDAPNFAAIVDALEEDAAGLGIASILLSSGDNFIPGPLFNAGGDFSLSATYEGFYNSLFGLIDDSVLDTAADTNGDGFFDNSEIEVEILAGNVTFDAVYTTDVNGDGFKDYFEEIDTFEGRIDVAIMNALGFDSSAVGNHEFDAGTDSFENTINYDSEEGNSLSTSRYDANGVVTGHLNYLQEVDTPGVQFPYLTANLDFSQDFDVGALFTTEILPNTDFASDLLSARDDSNDPTVSGSDSNDAKIAPATIITVDGEQIGVVGATTQVLSSISSTGSIVDTSNGGAGNDMAALAAVLQPVIDDLTDQGVDKIILTSHLQQFSLEQELAGLLSGVDIIFAGGSDTISADDQDRLRAEDLGAETQPYPVVVEDLDGNSTLIASTDGEYSYVGRLVVDFDDNGNVLVDSIDENISGAYATDDQGVLDVTGEATVEDAIDASQKATDVAHLAQSVIDIVTATDADIAGEASVFLNGERSSVRTEETNLGNLTADANLIAVNKAGFDAVVSIKNGGGIRAPIGEIIDNGDGTASFGPTADNPLSGKEAGEISELDIDNALRFDNGLVVVDLSTADLKIILEHAVSAVAEGATPGQFPQVGGIRFSFDPDGVAQELGDDGVPTTEGSRIKNVMLLDADGNPSQLIIEDGEVVDGAPESIQVVTLNFLAGGGDGYPFEALGTVVDTGIGEQAALSDFLTENFPEDGPDAFDIADTPVGQDLRIQNLNERSDTVDTPIATLDVTFSEVVTFQGDSGDPEDPEGTSEVVSHEDGKLYVTNGAQGRIDIFDIASETQSGFIDLTDLTNFAGVQSVAVKNGLVVAAIENEAFETESGDLVPRRGAIAIFDAESGELIDYTSVGYLPDNVVFSADGTQIYTANEGENDDDFTFDPAGSISIIDIAAEGVITEIREVGFEDFNDKRAELENRGVRLFEGSEVSEDLEPEYIAVDPNTGRLIVSLQEANAFAIVDPVTAEVLDIISAGFVDHSKGLPTLETFDFDDLPLLGVDGNGLEIDLGGFSGLTFGGEEDGQKIFYTVPDRGPNGSEVVEGARTFNLPDYQAQVVKLALDEESGTVEVVEQILLFREDGETPITGLPNDEGLDETPVDALGNALPYDTFGADMESIVVAPDGTFWMSDEYRPAIYHFGADGVLIDRFIPEGVAESVGEDEGTFGTESLPEDYAERRPNRGFEAMTLDEETGILYTFIQTPLANPDRDTSNASDVIRILAVDATTGEPVAEYVYLLEDLSGDVRPGGRIDKIGDAAFDPETGKIFVIERDASFGAEATKNIFEIDLSNATNTLELDLGDQTLEQMSADDLADAGINAAQKLKIANLPSLGYTPSDKAEGLTVLPDGSLAVLNDNDFGIEDSSGLLPQLGIISFDKSNGLDPNDNGEIDIINAPLLGMRMADAIASFELDGRTFFASANEGDARNEDARVADLVEDGLLDPALVEKLLAEGLIDDDPDTDIGIERLEVSSIDGDTDGDGDIDQIHSYGSRSFTIYDEFGNVVFDSGDDFEQILAQIAPERFNDDDGEDDEDRSDAKGPEPEAITVGVVDGKTYAFIGLERDSGIMIYDVTDPSESFFVNYIPGFDDEFGENPGDNQGPEVITFISAEESTTGNAQIAVAYEISGTTVVYDIAANKPLINEVLMSHTGTDDSEFVELSGKPGFSLEGLSLISFNANADEAGDLNLQIDFTADDVIGDNGFFLIGNPTGLQSNFGVLPNISIGQDSFENDSQIFALVETASLVVNDGTVVDDPSTVIVDSVGFVNSDLDIVNFFDAPIVGPDGEFLPAGGFRLEEGVDTDTAEDFGIADFFIEDNSPTAGTGIDGDVEAVSIPEIQGAGHVSAFAGLTVLTTGIVTAIDAAGYYIQDPEGDGDIATSDAIFVFTGFGDVPEGLAIGDEVEVIGPVSEFIPGGASTGNLSITQISTDTVNIVSSGNDLPAATVIGVAGRTPPTDVIISEEELPVNLQDEAGTFNPEVDGIDFYESLEGMLVTLDDPVAISATSRFGETFVAVDDGANVTSGSEDGGLNDRGALNINADADGYGDLNPERIQIQFDTDMVDDSAIPDGINVGDNLSDVTGVVSYAFGNYEVLTTEGFEVEAPSSNEAEVTEITSGDDQLKIATYNVLNITSNADDGDADQIAALAAQIVDNLGSPDILALQEIQDNSGVTDDGETDADETLQAIVDAIADAGGPVYSFESAVVDVDGETGGVPGGNIRNAFLYNAERVTPTEFVTLEVEELTDLGVSNPAAFEGTRDPLLGVFEFNGEEITLINNHFTSRFGSDPVFGGPQPFVQAGEAEREAEALALNQVVDALLAEDAEARVVVLGDLNTFDFTDELAEDLPGVGDEKVLTNLIGELEGDEAYTFIFQGNSQVLDHVFATDSLVEGGFEVDVVHVNNDFVDFVSDHEPVVVSFTIEGSSSGEEIIGTVRSDELEGTDGDDQIFALQADDTVFGRDGDDLIDGGTRSDSMFGGLGDDDIFGRQGMDFAFGDDGNDLIEGGTGDDNLFGGDDDDDLFGEQGRDDLFGGDGNDFLDGGIANDNLFGGDDDDQLFGQNGDDFLSGEGGDDTLDGGKGRDIVDGGDGNDVLFGGFFRDTMIGGEGDDTQTGGRGRDTFFFTGLFGDDDITDFSTRLDTLEIDGVGLGDVSAISDGVDTVITVDAANTQGTITLLGVDAFDLDTLIV